MSEDYKATLESLRTYHDLSDEEWNATPATVKAAMAAHKSLSDVQVNQLSTNNKFLLEHADRVCNALAPGSVMVWQDRVKLTANRAELMRWHDCSKKLPEPYATVLLYVEDEDDHPGDGLMAEGYHTGGNDGKWCWLDSREPAVEQPLYWMYRPIPPERKAKALALSKEKAKA
jgi:hypothetical protein